MGRLFGVLSLILLVIAAAPLAADDPGQADTVRLGPAELVVNQSVPIPATVFSDEVVQSMYIPLVWTTADGGYARFDSISYSGRLTDPSVLNARLLSTHEIDDISPDTIRISLLEQAAFPLPPGYDTCFNIYYTGLAPGKMTIEHDSLPPDNGYFFAFFEDGSSSPFIPKFVCDTITITDGLPLPELSITGSKSGPVGSSFNLTIDPSSPFGSPVSASLVSLHGWDDSLMTPSGGPQVQGADPLQFSWSPGASDVGIWRARFQACDTSGGCIERDVMLQVISDNEYNVSFNMTSTENAGFVRRMISGDFDQSTPEPELFLSTKSTYENSTAVEVLQFDPLTGQYTDILNLEHNRVLFSVATGFVDTNDYLDLVMIDHENKINSLLGTGDGQFNPVLDSWVSATIEKGGRLFDIDGDGVIDYAFGTLDGVSLCQGSADGLFSKYETFGSGGQVYTLNTADFNMDGHKDLAVGTPTAMEIWTGADGPGGFTLAHSYPQVYGVQDIEVTNEGSDFNLDGFYDLSLAVPSVGGTESEIVVYMGNGDGSFEVHPVRLVLGQVSATRAADINLDGYLDIVYINGPQKRIGILYGDGTGEFMDEVRLPAPRIPRELVCTDQDLDGDVDIIVSCYQSATLHADDELVFYRNESDPPGITLSNVCIQSEDYADVEVVSPTGKKLSRVIGGIPSGSFFERQLNANDVLDEQATLKAVEPGDYQVAVRPNASGDPGAPFGLRYERDGQLFRIVKEGVLPESTIVFPMSLSHNASAVPRQGAFVAESRPMFSWHGTGYWRFELARDWNFDSVLISVVAPVSAYLPPDPIVVEDTALYYWRISPEGSNAYQGPYAINLTATSDILRGDLTGDGLIDISDITSLVDGLFLNPGTVIELERGDLTRDGSIDISDLTFLVRYLFGSSPK